MKITIYKPIGAQYRQEKAELIYQVSRHRMEHIIDDICRTVVKEHTFLSYLFVMMRGILWTCSQLQDDICLIKYPEENHIINWMIYKMVLEG